MSSHSPNEVTAFQYAIQPISDAFKFIKALFIGFLKSIRAFFPPKIRLLIPISETNESTQGLSFARTFLYSQLEHWYVIFSILLASVPFIIMTAGWDMAGVQLYQKKASITEGVFEHKVNMADFVEGTYLVFLRLPNGFSVQKKVVKVK